MLERLWTWMRAEDEGPGFSRLRWRLFWIAFAVRVLYILLARTYHVRLANDHFQFAWEMGRIARALANGYGFADPFAGHTGPTAWSPPVYPLLLAGIFKLFGVYSNASALVILIINSIFSAAIAPAAHEIANRCYSRRVALWSGWAWALYPGAIQYAVHWIWEMSLTTCFFTWVLIIALRIRGIGDSNETPSRITPTLLWAAFGLLWGLIFLLNSTLILFLPACALWMLATKKHALLPSLSRATLAGIFFLACLAPWVYRNWQVFHAFIPSRGNLGAELYQSMLPSHGGFPWGTTVPPIEQDPELQLYRRMGEVAYVRQRGDEAKALIHQNPSQFATWTLKRIYFFWVSVPKPPEHGILNETIREMNYCFFSLTGLLGLALSLRRRIPAAGLFACAFLLIPVPYYLLTVQARFRHPLEPLITIFTVFLFQSATRRANRPTENASLKEQIAR
jgi:4-amino-4-deoxy-L-arabinose transferase and related glycosyltransferases of PMT family